MSTIDFKSAEFIFSKIKREFKSFSSVNLLDDSEFPTYTAEVLKKLNVSTINENVAVLVVKDGQAPLPVDFQYIYGAYKCCPDEDNFTTRHYQNQSIFEDVINRQVFTNGNKCNIQCEGDKIIERITVQHYINDNDFINKRYKKPTLLKLSPNVRDHCTKDCMNINISCKDEISIRNKTIFTNFNDGDIYLHYYGFQIDENNIPKIPNITEVEKAVEWYIKWQVLLNYWLVDDLANALAKWQKAEQEYEKAMAEARYILKLPSFNYLVNYTHNLRGINKVAFFSQLDRNR